MLCSVRKIDFFLWKNYTRLVFFAYLCNVIVEYITNHE